MMNLKWLSKPFKVGILFKVMAVCAISLLPAAAQTCNVTYTIVNSWPGGFQAGLTIANTGSSALTNWTLAWTFSGNQKIGSLWNGVVTQTGAAVVVANASYNGAIPAKGSVTGIGFTATVTGANAVPTAFTLNAAQCNGGGVPQPPAAPTGLTAATISTASVNLSWTASTTSGATYNVYRSATAGFTPSAATRIASAIATTTFADSGLAASTTFYYLVTAVNAVGESGPSNQASASTLLTVTSINPATGMVGSSVTLAGQAFGLTQGASTVRFGVTPAAVTSWSSNSIAVTVPTLALGAVSVTVTVNGIAGNPIGFTVTNTPPNPSYTGNATWFTNLGSPYGGCGLPQANLDSQNFVAVNVQNTPGNYSTFLPRPIPPQDAAEIGFFDNGLNCGRWVQVTIGNYCTGVNDGAPGQPFCRGGSWVADQYNGATLNMIVADSCQDGNAWCRDDPNHLDLAQAAINQFVLNGQPVGNLLNKWNNRQITWQFITAPNYTGDISIGIAQGSNPYWTVAAITHLQNGIHGVDYLVNGVWTAAKTNSDLGEDYVILPTATAGSSYQIRVYDVTNQLINNGRNYLFSFPASCGQQCGPAYTPVTYTVQ